MHAAAIPDELVELSAELEALGGGDTRVGEATVFCRVRPVERASEAPIVTVGSSGSHMLVRDPRTSDTTPAAHAVRRFRISPGGAIGGAAALAAPVGRGATQSDVAASVGREALEWWLAGFNASVIAHGQTGAGKTYSLYGPAAAVYAESVPPDAMGLVPRLLGRVYEAIEAAATSEDGAPRLSLGVSCFEVRHASVVDLLAPEQRGGGGGGGVGVAVRARGARHRPGGGRRRRAEKWSARGAAARGAAADRERRGRRHRLVAGPRPRHRGVDFARRDARVPLPPARRLQRARGGAGRRAGGARGRAGRGESSARGVEGDSCHRGRLVASRGGGGAAQCARQFGGGGGGGGHTQGGA
mmetsp:Transcript_34706/g.104188  ORF Transcript_34706/g.104188 Transcript_34706/m.104188 type:complete len:357 (-) Transcript_34706:151-1221(-)